MIGTILHTIWGYSMTLNDYCKIIGVSPSGKTVKCIMLKTIVEGDDSPAGGYARPSDETYGKPFNLKIVSGFDGEQRFRGSYAYTEGSDSKHMGNFKVWSGKPNAHNTWD